MRRRLLLALCLMVCASPLLGQGAERTRLLEELNWLVIGKLVPDSINTVLIAAGTVEPHGVVHNGADNTVPYELARRLAPRVNALVAPTISYGVTVTLDEYPGTLGIGAETFEAYAYETLRGLARAGFKNVIVLNGHGPNAAPLRSAAERAWRETDARFLITEWWSLTADLVQEIWGSEGGHAGNNETGAVLGLRPDLVHPELYSGPEMTTPRGEGWTAYPFPSSVVLYKEGEGYPEFDEEKAQRFVAGVVDRLEALIEDVIAKWDRAGL